MSSGKSDPRPTSQGRDGHQRHGGLGRWLTLILYKTYADLKAESQRTYAGFVWWIIEPAVSMLVYYVVFSVLLERRGEEFIAFLFAGVVPWRWFQSTVMRGSKTIAAARGLMQQVHLPKIVFPMTGVLGDTVKFLIVFVVLLAYLALTGRPPNSAYLALPVVLAVELLVITAATSLAAGIVPFLPDLRIVLQNILRLVFFLSGVFYEISRFPDTVQGYLRLNPMAVILESFRAVLLDGHWPDLTALAWIALVSSLALVTGWVLILRWDHVYPKLST